MDLILGGLITTGGIGNGRLVGRLVPLTGQFSQEYIGTASGAMETIKGVLTSYAYRYARGFRQITMAFYCFAVLVHRSGDWRYLSA